jgi:multiple sugar transport system permease protein
MVNHILLILALLVTLYPFVWVLLLSLKTQADAFNYEKLFVFTPTIKNYIKLLSATNFSYNLLNSFIIATSATFLTLGIGTPAAYVLSRVRMRAQNTVLLFVLTSRMIPPMAFIIPYFIVFNTVGLIDTRIGLILIYIALSLGLVVWAMWTFFDEIPIEMDESARIDGASVFQTFRKIILPLSAHGMASTGIISFVMVWNEFLFALILTRRDAVTAPVAISSGLAFETMDIGFLTAGSIVVSAPVIAFYFIMQKYIRRGLMGGAIKG